MTALGCGAPDVAPVDPEGDGHPSFPADAEIADDADVPLLPPIDDEEPDASVADDRPAVDAPDVAPAMDAPTPRDAPAVDVPTPRDAPAVDVPTPRDVPAPRCTGSASGQSSVWTCTADRRARQRCVLGRVETDACPHGCEAHPSGTNDTCAPAPPAAPQLPACARRPLLHWGLHPDASDRLRCAGVPDARIVQTIGNAAASAGTHGVDGHVGGAPYSAATDLSTRSLSTADVHALLDRLANQGFAAWYRWPGHDGWPSSEAPHIHAIYVGCAMKASLRSQVGSWLAGRNGLVSNTRYAFHAWSAAQRALIRAVYDRHN
jgi:hypothetical protein